MYLIIYFLLFSASLDIQPKAPGLPSERTHAEVMEGYALKNAHASVFDNLNAEIVTSDVADDVYPSGEICSPHLSVGSPGSGQGN